MKKIVNEEMVNGLDCDMKYELNFCKPCIESKHNRQKFPKVGGKRASEILELVHTDVCGEIETKSLSGKKYFLTFIDDKSRYLWTYAIRKKSEVFEKFLNWKNMEEKSSGKKLKKLRSDNGGEYISSEFTKYLETEGIHGHVH